MSVCVSFTIHQAEKATLTAGPRSEPLVMMLTYNLTEQQKGEKLCVNMLYDICNECGDPYGSQEWSNFSIQYYAL